MFDFLQALPTTVALNATHQAMRLLQHRVKSSVRRSQVVIKGISSNPTPLEFKIARKIVREIQDAEGCSILSVAPHRVQNYVGKLADLMLKRVNREGKFDPAKTQGLLDNLKQYEPTRGSKYSYRNQRLRKRTKAVDRVSV